MFARPLQLKMCSCSFCGQAPQKLHPYVNIFVRVTVRCPAACDFCANAANRHTKDMPFDEDKLIRIIDALIERDIFVKRINITGGEPSVVPSRVESLLSRLTKLPYSLMHTHLNTNGLNSTARALMLHPRWDSISVSLHHDEEKQRREIYHLEQIEEFSLPDGLQQSKINASCNLIRGYVDCPAAARKMMRYAMRMGFPRLGFVSLMPTNEYCRSHFVDYSELRLETISGVSFVGERHRLPHCRCRNYLYKEGEHVLEIYMRRCLNPNDAASVLVYDGTHLYQGFGKGEVLC